jgi:hypothetical protein
MNLLARIKSFNYNTDHYGLQVSILVFSSFESALRCYNIKTGRISFNDLTVMLKDSSNEVFHIKLNNGKLVIVLEIKEIIESKLKFYKILCDGRIYWVNEYNIEIC